MKNKNLSTNEILGLKSITNFQKKDLIEIIKMNMSEEWCFKKTYEKLILIITGFLAIWKIWGFVF